jgi:hypothetical protein
MGDANFPLSPNRVEILPGDCRRGLRRRNQPLSTKGLWQVVSFSNVPLDVNDAVGETVLPFPFDASRRILALYEWVEEGKNCREWLDAGSFLNPESLGMALGHAVDSGNCLLCALRNRASDSPIGSVHGARKAWGINVCGDHGRFLQRRDRRGQAIVTVQGDIERLQRDEDEPRDVRAWLRVGWRGIGYWRLADSDLRDLGVNFRHI